MALEVIPIGKIVENGELTRIAMTVNTNIRKERTQQLLHSRHLLGVVRRHEGRLSNSEQAVSAARRLHTTGKLGVYVLREQATYVGMATVDPEPVLRKQIIAIPPKFARGPLSHGVELPGPEVTAWVSPGHGPSGLNNLTEAYKALRTPYGIAGDMYARFANENNSAPIDVHAWTIEPLDAPQWIHTAIRSAGFVPEGSKPGYYDDGESKRYAPPMSRLYIAPNL